MISDPEATDTQIEANQGFERVWSRAQIGLQGLIAIAVVAGLAGLFGDGWFSTTTRAFPSMPLSVTYERLLRDLMTMKSNLLEAFPTISGLDKPESVPFDEVEQHVPELEAASPTWGRIYAWGLTTCAGYTARSTETPRPLRGAGAAPIVVIGTTRDPATPFSEAQALASQLESAVLVSRDGDGHTAYSSGNECIADAVEDYLVDGTVPEDGLEC